MLQTIRNDEGEILGTEQVYEPDPSDFQDQLDALVSDDPEPFEGCCAHGDWQGSNGQLNLAWRCSYCGELVPLTVHKGRGLVHPLEHFDRFWWPEVPCSIFSRHEGPDESVLAEAGLL
jgi:hypothetical protein